MIEAGLYELNEHRFGENIKPVLEEVYRAMAYASQGNDSACAKSVSR
jgi:hypothetical protein